MNHSYQVLVYDEQQKLLHTANLTGAAELGRQGKEEEKLFSNEPVGGRRRVVISNKEERTISRQHALLEPLPEGGFRLTNQSRELTIGLPGRQALKAKESITIPADALFFLGNKRVRLRGPSAHVSQLHGLSESTAPPGRTSFFPRSFGELALPRPDGIEVKALVPWLQAAMEVLQAAAGSDDFFKKAAEAVVRLINLDSSRVLLLKGGEWHPQAVYGEIRATPDGAQPFSSRVLDRVFQEKTTFWEEIDPESAGMSLSGVDAVVAAPILDRNGAVIGALYGERRLDGTSPTAEPISELQAMLVEVLARGVAAGLARLEQERAALAARVQFEQFFTPQLSRQLALNPGLLEGRDGEVSILFCDIRGFSRIAERLGPSRTVSWVGKVMEELSECVLNQEGVLVDYIGDELMAMWGAPEEQSDHAQRACRAALEMLERLPKLNERWRDTLGELMGIGIGINTGMARVGNIGSSHKFKYGPLGNTVNLASRVQGATKYLKCKLLITGGTHGKLTPEFATRRLCQVRVVNISEPVTLYELVPNNQPGWPAAKVEYERALTEFEASSFAQAARVLGSRQESLLADAPAVLLLHRVVQCLVEEPHPFDPVWELPGK